MNGVMVVTDDERGWRNEAGSTQRLGDAGSGHFSGHFPPRTIPLDNTPPFLHDVGHPPHQAVISSAVCSTSRSFIYDMQ